MRLILRQAGLRLRGVGRWVGTHRPGEVEVAVIGQVDDRRFVGGGAVVQHELVLLGEGVSHRNLHSRCNHATPHANRISSRTLTCEFLTLHDVQHQKRKSEGKPRAHDFLEVDRV